MKKSIFCLGRLEPVWTSSAPPLAHQYVTKMSCSSQSIKKKKIWLSTVVCMACGTVCIQINPYVAVNEVFYLTVYEV